MTDVSFGAQSGGDDNPLASSTHHGRSRDASPTLSLATRVTLAMAALVLLSVLAVGELLDRSFEKAVVPRVQSRLGVEVGLLTKQLTTYVGSARQDLAVLRSVPVVEALARAHAAGGIDPVDNASETVWRRRVEQLFVLELSAKPVYEKMRIIAIDTGREIARVDRRGKDGTIRIVAEDELRDRSNQPIFKAALAAPTGQLYVAPVELDHNSAPGESGAPAFPVLRVVARVDAPEHPSIALFVIDVDMRTIFRDIAAVARPGGGIYLVNGAGDYLVHPDAKRQFASERGDSTRWQDDFSELAAGFNRDTPTVMKLADREGKDLVAGIDAVELPGGPRVGVIESVPLSNIMAPVWSVRQTTVWAGSIAFLLACGVAVLLARSMTRPLVRMTAAAKAFPEEPCALPIDAAGEIGELARAFARMMEEVKTKTASLEREIREHGRTEAELARHADRERLFGAAVQSSNDAIITMTLDGVVTGWNPAAARLFGWSAEEMFGRPITTIVPKDRTAETSRIFDRIRRGETISHHETIHIHKDGHAVDVSLSVSPIKLPSGAIIGACKIARDITEAKKAGQLFEQESNERRRLAAVFHNTITSMVDAVLVADQKANILLANPVAERLFGITAGMNLPEWTDTLDVFEPDGVTPVATDQRPLLRAIRGESFENYEIVVRRRGEANLTVLLTNGGPLHRGPDDQPGALVVYRDITEVKETERQLRQSQKMEAVGQLTGGIAHDFNNILTVITGTIDMLMEGVADRPQLAAIAKMIDDAAQRGAELTQRLVAFSRRQPLMPRPTNVNDIIVDAARLLRPSLGEAIEINAILDDAVWPALIDPGQLTTALLNLAINARDAMAQGGRLMLETANVAVDASYAAMNPDIRIGEYVMISVTDTGSGIPADLTDKVFEPFFTTKDVGKGTGLGLSMVYGFVKQSGGHIKIYSEANHGTTVKMYLPRADASTAQSAEPAIETSRGGDETILVVEDDALVRGYVVTRINALGYRTIAATTAAEALAILDGDEAIDLLFTDMVMPGTMNGRALADAAVQRRPGLRVVYSSGYAESAIVHHGQLDPGAFFLAKPYRKSDLAHMLRAALDAESAPRPEPGGERGTRFY